MFQQRRLQKNVTTATLIENKITELLLEVLDQYAPLKYRPKKKNNTDLKLSSKYLDLIKDRNNNKNLAKTTRKDEDWNKWKIAKNLVNNKIRNERITIEENKMLEISDDATVRQLW